MLVIPKKRVLLLKLQHPERVTAVIPSAKQVELKGAVFVAIPHRVEETRILRNLGIQAPSPIRYHYGWPQRPGITPFQAQKETSEFLTLQGNAFVLNEIGTGKTLAALWAYDYLRAEGLVNRALIVSSLSTLERAWGDEIFANFSHLNFNVLHGTRERRLKLLAAYADIYIINHDGVKTAGFADAMAKREDIDLVVIDEIANAGRNASADRWKALNKLCNKQVKRRVWGMTGKPTPNAPTDAWAQCKLVNASTIPPYFNRFRDAVMRQVGPFTWLPRDSAAEVVSQAMQPAIRFTRDQCVDLPPTIYQTRQVEMTSEQRKAYKEMVNTLRAEVEAGEVLAVNEAVKVGKLLQIACGVAYGPSGELVDIPSAPRIDVVKEIIEEAEGKVIVFVPYRGALEKVRKEIHHWLNPADFTRSELNPGHIGVVAKVDGSTSKHRRDEVFRAFQQTAAPQVLVAQPAAMSHGLTLTAANTIVWYAAVWNNEIYEQANGRITRPGQRNTQFIINVEGSAIERKLYERLRNKQALQGLLLDLVKAAVSV